MDLSSIISLGGAAASGIGGAKGASDAKAALTNFSPALYKPADVTAGQEQFLDQGALLPEVAALLKKSSDQDNAAYQARIAAINPSLAPSIGNISSKASDYSQGVIAQDVQDEIQRHSAYQALQGGYGGSSFADDTFQKNLGLKRIQEESQASAINEQALGLSASLSPTNPNVADTLLTPAALLQRQDANDLFNNQILNQQKVLNAQAAAAKGSILFGTNTGGSAGGGAGLSGL